MSNMKLIMENWRKAVKKETLREGIESLPFDEKVSKYLRLFKSLHPKYGQPEDVEGIFKKAMKMQLVTHPEGMGSKWQENDKLSPESEETIDRIAQELRSNVEPMLDKHRENSHPYGRPSIVSEMDEINAEVKKHIEKALEELKDESEV